MAACAHGRQSRREGRGQEAQQRRPTRQRCCAALADWRAGRTKACRRPALPCSARAGVQIARRKPLPLGGRGWVGLTPRRALGGGERGARWGKAPPVPASPASSLPPAAVIGFARPSLGQRGRLPRQLKRPVCD